MNSKSSREIDALVSEKVLNIHIVWDIDEVYTDKGKLSRDVRREDAIPHYSTRIEDAWKIVDSLYRQGKDFRLETGTQGWYVRIAGDEGSVMEYATDAPLAICLAALKYLGVNQICNFPV